MPSLDDCPKTALPIPSRAAGLPSELVPALRQNHRRFNRNARLLCVGTREKAPIFALLRETPCPTKEDVARPRSASYSGTTDVRPDRYMARRGGEFYGEYERPSAQAHD
jgi:hypothetical protein